MAEPQAYQCRHCGGIGYDNTDGSGLCPRCATRPLPPTNRDHKSDLDRIARAVFPHKQTYSVDLMIEEIERLQRIAASFAIKLLELRAIASADPTYCRNACGRRAERGEFCDVCRAEKEGDRG
jgi:hypothetical protein